MADGLEGWPLDWYVLILGFLFSRCGPEPMANARGRGTEVLSFQLAKMEEETGRGRLSDT